ncbi:ComEA family DNA-binding protein [Sphingobacterium hungaricum]|uniref:Helix-hairpin-helix motif-containing protein n=1 Tax=Sphingobacterium hungaricum TaxID=2082723 RepID=A0A928V0E7_9SPHI|nr:helix-hairpin-helix domain-containing protein [Sphingobacterium hungaricum]MBE8715458.1 hypothetical protein [Sphingobacterium hungaricum]
MNFKLCIGLLIFFSLFGNCVLAQQEEALEEEIIEQLLSEIEEEIDLSEFTERLRYFLRHPIDLNKTNEEELGSLLFLLPNQIANLLDYRASSGNFISVLELQSVDGFDLQTVRKMMPFVTVKADAGLNLPSSGLGKSTEHDLMVRYGRIIESQAGYHIEDTTRSRYLGSPDRYSLRYRMNYKSKIQLAINAEKDAGEPFFGELQPYGFDYYSMSLQIKDLGKWNKVVVGDYALQFGQGLVLWNGLSFGKGAWLGSATKQASGLKAYTSMNEFNFLRGLSGTLKLHNFEITPFISYNFLTGNIEEVDGQEIVSSISSSGLHRTPSELENKNSVNQLVFGTDITYRKKQLKLGFTAINTQYSHLISKGDELRNEFSFEGKQLLNLGLNYQYSFKNTYFYGETAHSWGSGFASLNGLLTSLHPNLSVSIQHRYYEKNYHSIFAQAIGENSDVSNEHGIYAGFLYKILRKIEWVNYLDVYRFPWLSYLLDSPGSGLDYLSQMTYTWYKKGRLILRYRHRLDQENTSLDERNELISADLTRNQGRADFQYELNDSWKIGSRFEAVNYQKEFEQREYGWMCYQDLFWTSSQKWITANMRIAYFDTDSYNARIYAYESDVLYASSFPVYYMQGWRTYFNTKIKITRKLDFWFRYSLTKYNDLEEVGSGLDLIAGNKKSDFRIQFKYQW